MTYGVGGGGEGEGIDNHDSSADYTKINITPRVGNDNSGQVQEENEKKGYLTRQGDIFVGYCGYLKRMIINPVLEVFKCHWTGKIVGSVLQTMVIGDLISDLIFIRSVMEYKVGWWVFFSFLILYLSLRFTLFFTLVFEQDFFGVKESEGRLSKIVFNIWNALRRSYFISDMDDEPVYFFVCFIPGVYDIFNLLFALLEKFGSSSNMYELLSSLPEGIIYFIAMILRFIINEVIVFPICVVFISPIILLGHVLKGINGVWNTNSVSFYENSFDVQTLMFYATIASLFETLTESLPQFLLQSWIYYHSHDLIPASTYYTSVGFSLFNILKAMYIYITTRKQLKFSSYRLAKKLSGNIEWSKDHKKLHLPGWPGELIIQMVKEHSALQDLDISGARYITGYGVCGVNNIVGHLRQLKSLNISGTDISDKSIKCLAENCNQLNTLNLGDINIGNEGLQAVAEHCKQLIFLTLRDTKVSDEGVKALAENCVQLKSLNLCGTNITDEGVTIIAKNCRLLETLELGNTKLTDTGLKAIGEKCNQLNTLNLRYTTVSGEGLKVIAENCEQLKFLNLEGTNIADDVVAIIAENCEQLKSLNLCDTNITDEGVTIIAKNCHLFDTLELGNTKISNEGLKAIGENHNQLTTLNLRDTNIGDEGLKVIVENCEHLKSLNLQRTNINDEGVTIIAENCKQLKSLNLCDTNITDEGVAIIAKSCHLLDTLELGNTKITDIGLKAIGENCKQMKSLDIQEANISDEGLIAIAIKCHRLESINLMGNETKVTDLSVTLLLKNCTRLRELRLPTALNNSRGKYYEKYPRLRTLSIDSAVRKLYF